MVLLEYEYRKNKGKNHLDNVLLLLNHLTFSSSLMVVVI